MKTKCRGRQRGFQHEGASGLFRFLQGFFWKGGKVFWLGPCLLCSLRAEGAHPAPVPVEREAPWRIANFSQHSGVLRRRIFDVAFQADSTAWFAVSDVYHWRRFTVTNGLPSNFIRAVTVVRDSSLWVGTDQGAGVFDGTTFNRRGTEGRLAGPHVRRIVESSDGALWFCCDRWPDATQPGSLTRYQAGIFQNFGIAKGLPSDHLLNFFEKSNGRFLAMTNGGACGLGRVQLSSPG